MSGRIPIERRLQTLRKHRDAELKYLDKRVAFEHLTLADYQNTREFIKDYFDEWEKTLVTYYESLDAEA